jgi:hypothetical protein
MFIKNDWNIDVGLNYLPSWFNEKAEELRILAYKHDEEL